MKIVKMGKDIKGLAEKRKLANEECDICPCCGESRYEWEYGLYELYSIGICKRHVDVLCSVGFFKFKWKGKDKYKCRTCGAKWESELYEE